jgi:autotransporter-associated beta strand protein
MRGENSPITNAAGLGECERHDERQLGQALELSGTGLSVAEPLNTISGTLSNVTGSNTWTGNVTLASTIDVASGTTLTMSGQLSGSNGVSEGGTGKLVLSNNTNNFTGVMAINAGVVNITQNNAVGRSGRGQRHDGGDERGVGNRGRHHGRRKALSLDGTGVSNGGDLRNISGANIWQGLITLAAAAEIQSDAGTLTLDPATGDGGHRNVRVDGGWRGRR